MYWIMMQLATGKQYQHASIVLKDTRNYFSDLSPCGAWLQPIKFGFCSCTDFERKYHFFVGETAYGKWIIGKNLPYL